MTDAGNGHRHDTIVLGQSGTPTQDSVVWTPPATPGPAAASVGWGPAPAWSNVPPFLSNGSTPVVIARNNAAVVGATLGSVSLFLALIPLIGIVSWLLAPIGLISSAVGLVVGMRRRVGRVGALWGLVTSGLALLICVLWLALLLAL